MVSVLQSSLDDERVAFLLIVDNIYVTSNLPCLVWTMCVRNKKSPLLGVDDVCVRRSLRCLCGQYMCDKQPSLLGVYDECVANLLAEHALFSVLCVCL